MSKNEKRLKVAEAVAERLFTVSHGTKYAEKGNRLAVMKEAQLKEKSLGGWCFDAAKSEIAAVLLEKGVL